MGVAVAAIIISHTRTVVRECFKGDEASQWIVGAKIVGDTVYITQLKQQKSKKVHVDIMVMCFQSNGTILIFCCFSCVM